MILIIVKNVICYTYIKLVLTILLGANVPWYATLLIMLLDLRMLCDRV